MKTVEAIRYKARLDNLFGKITALSSDIELQAQWARYLCVLVSGFLETSVVAILARYSKEKAVPNVANYVGCQLDTFQNPTMGKILQLVNAFSQDWYDSLSAKTDGKLKSSVDSIAANRNQIAHGRDVGITYASIRTWYVDALEVVELLDTLVAAASSRRTRR